MPGKSIFKIFSTYTKGYTKRPWKVLTDLPQITLVDWKNPHASFFFFLFPSFFPMKWDFPPRLRKKNEWKMLLIGVFILGDYLMHFYNLTFLDVLLLSRGTYINYIASFSWISTLTPWIRLKNFRGNCVYAVFLVTLSLPLWNQTWFFGKPFSPLLKMATRDAIPRV